MRWLKRRSGIALVLALFTTAILMILSVSFLSLAYGESRNSRTAGYEGAAVQAANFGIGLAINYMGRGGPIPGAAPGVTVWDDVPNPNGLGFFNVLHAPASFIHNNLPINVALGSTPNARTLAVANPGGALAFQACGQNMQFTVSVSIVPIITKGIPSYELLSTGVIWARPQGLTPLATRVIEARVLEQSAASYLHFVSNGRSDNVQGQGAGEVNDIQNQILATNIIIPPGYVENGAMRVDGQSTAGANATNLFAQASGNLTFGPGTALNKPKFENQLTINALANGYDDKGLVDQNSGFFTGGFSPGVASMGLPNFQEASANLLKAASNVTPGSQNVNGLIQWPTANIMGNGTIPPQYLGRQTFNSANPPADQASAIGDPFVASFNTTIVNGQPASVPVGPDYRPRFPNTNIQVTNDQVTITNVSTLDGSVFSSGTYNVSQFQQGVIDVQGGNAVIKGGVNATGQLTILATSRDTTATNNGREVDNATVYNPQVYNAAYNTTSVTNESMYAQASQQAQDYYQYMAEVARTTVYDPTQRAADYAAIKTPPYSVADLQALQGVTYPANPANPSDNHAGIQVLTSPIPAADSSRKFFPPPGAPSLQTDSAGNVVMDPATGQPSYYAATPRVDREGNLVMTGDFAYNTADRTTSMGFLAQNFVLLNDNNSLTNNSMTIQGVMMSGERSLQLDWDNTARQPTNTWQQMVSPGFNGTVNLKGSIVGEYIDVEGDYDKRGFFNQSFQYDPQLQYQLPPYFPQWDFSQLPGGFQYVIVHYVDKGAISSEGAAQ